MGVVDLLVVVKQGDDNAQVDGVLLLVDDVGLVEGPRSLDAPLPCESRTTQRRA